MIRLRQLEVFYAVMTTGSLRGAAELLHVSQPAASKLLRYAEQSLGFPLFERAGGRLVPTREARIMLPHTNAIFDKLSDLKQLTANLRFARDGHSIRIGCVPSLGLSVVPRVAQRYHAGHPGNELTIDTMHGTAVVAGVLSHGLDLGIVFGDYVEDGLTTRNIADIPLLLIDREAHRSPVPLGELDPQRYIGLSARDPTALLLDMALDEAGLTVSPSIRVRTHYMAAEFARLGAGYAIVDALTALSHAGVPSPVALSPFLRIACTVIFRADYSLSRIAEAILALLQEEIGRDLARLPFRDAGVKTSG